jgi:hypothetical protein
MTLLTHMDRTPQYKRLKAHLRENNEVMARILSKGMPEKRKRLQTDTYSFGLKANIFARI